MTLHHPHPSFPPSYASYIFLKNSLLSDSRPQPSTLALSDPPPPNHYHKSGFYTGIHSKTSACEFACETWVLFLPLYLLLIVAVVTASLVPLNATLILLGTVAFFLVVCYWPFVSIFNHLICLPCYTTCCSPYLRRYFTWGVLQNQPLPSTPLKKPICLPKTACCYPKRYKIVETILSYWSLPAFQPLSHIGTSRTTSQPNFQPSINPSHSENLYHTSGPIFSHNDPTAAHQPQCSQLSVADPENPSNALSSPYYNGSPTPQSSTITFDSKQLSESPPMQSFDLDDPHSSLHINDPNPTSQSPIFTTEDLAYKVENRVSSQFSQTPQSTPHPLFTDLQNISTSSGAQQCVNWLHSHQQQQVRYIIRLETFRILSSSASTSSQFDQFSRIHGVAGGPAGNYRSNVQFGADFGYSTSDNALVPSSSQPLSEINRYHAARSRDDVISEENRQLEAGAEPSNTPPTESTPLTLVNPANVQYTSSRSSHESADSHINSQQLPNNSRDRIFNSQPTMRSAQQPTSHVEPSTLISPSSSGPIQSVPLLPPDPLAHYPLPLSSLSPDPPIPAHSLPVNQINPLNPSTIRTIGNTIDSAHRSQTATDATETIDESKAPAADQVMLMHIEDFELPLFNYYNSIRNFDHQFTSQRRFLSHPSIHTATTLHKLPEHDDLTDPLHHRAISPTTNSTNPPNIGLGTPLIDSRHGIEPVEFVRMVEKFSQQTIATVQIRDHLRVVIPNTSIAQSSVLGNGAPLVMLSPSLHHALNSKKNVASTGESASHQISLPPTSTNNDQSVDSPAPHQLLSTAYPTISAPHCSTSNPIVDLSQHGEVEQGLANLMLFIGQTYAPLYDPHSRIPITSMLSHQRNIQFRRELQRQEEEEEEGEQQQQQRGLVQSQADVNTVNLTSPTNNNTAGDTPALDDIENPTQTSQQPQTPSQPRMIDNPHYGWRVTGYWYFAGEFDENIEGEGGGLGYVSNLPQYLRYKKQSQSYTPLSLQHPVFTETTGMHSDYLKQQRQQQRLRFPHHNNNAADKALDMNHTGRFDPAEGYEYTCTTRSSHSRMDTNELTDSHPAPVMLSTHPQDNVTTHPHTSQTLTYSSTNVDTFGAYRGDGIDSVKMTRSPFQVSVIKVAQANQAYRQLYDHYRTLHSQEQQQQSQLSPESDLTQDSPSLFHPYRFPRLSCPTIATWCVFTPLLYLLFSLFGWLCCLHYCFHRLNRHHIYPNYITVYTNQSFAELQQLIRGNRLAHRTVYRNVSLIGPHPSLTANHQNID